ncbi:hypothetical protein Taro_035959 [Colocasia esculenta]|uniref:Uncharacterized protein n=1 Tax=Colocasia esculenta TaxID=4460 RepID=A0A843W5C7_COLES|nr:hypothetical protein [Colocasia esculenta]
MDDIGSHHGLLERRFGPNRVNKGILTTLPEEILTTLPEEILTTLPDSSRPSRFSGRSRDRYSREISRESREIAYHEGRRGSVDKKTLQNARWEFYTKDLHMPRVVTCKFRHVSRGGHLLNPKKGMMNIYQKESLEPKDVMDVY